MLMNKWGGLVIAVLVTAIACSKKTDNVLPPPATPQPVKGKLAKIIFDSGAYDSLYYGSGGELIKIKTVWDPASGISITHLFNYDAQGKLQHISTDHGEEYRYSYTGNQLHEVGLYIGGIKTRHTTYTYHQGVLTASHSFADILTNPNDQDFLDMFIYTYYPDGNLKTETSYSVHPVTGDPVKEITITYSDYDQQHNADDIFKQMPYHFGHQFAKNNARMRSIKNEKTGEITNYLFFYNYNESALPVSRRFEYYGGGKLGGRNM